MNSYDIKKLNNSINLISRVNSNTPRIAINFFMGTGVKYENLAGTANLTSRLLQQGTQTRSSEELVNELDSNAIELSIESKQDYIRIRVIFLNEDLEKALEILEDVIKNSTFNNLEKEKRKLTGELQLELDSPKTQAFDKLIRTMLPDHPYGNTHTKILQDINEISKQDILDYYSNFCLVPKKMVFSVVGDINSESIYGLLNQKFGSIKINGGEFKDIKTPKLNESVLVKIEREDTAQAQIIQGWFGPKISDDEFVVITVLNTVLGSSGLSSRLFLELRDKKGLAYHVRSNFEVLKHSGLFTVYIGTAPNNINTCLEGFKAEINKLKKEPVSKEELNAAKGNFLGKRAFLHETNSQQAYYLGFYDVMGLGSGYDSEIEEKIRNVKSEEIQEVANRFFSADSAISILAPEAFLSKVNSKTVLTC
jgi:predicted Zn-dependent peptidase